MLADHPLTYYKLAETSGTSAAGSSGNNLNGTYEGGYTLGQTGPISGNPDTAAEFALTRPSLSAFTARR